MGRPTKKGPPARVQLIVARNLKALLEATWPKERSETAAMRKLAEKSRTSLSQIQRALLKPDASGRSPPSVWTRWSA